MGQTGNDEAVDMGGFRAKAKVGMSGDRSQNFFLPGPFPSRV
jgi:hypothetical protein